MSDEPGFHARRVRLGVELQGQLPASGAEGLMRRHGAGGQQFRSGGQIKGVAVPVQHRGVLQFGQRPALPGRGQLQRAPADFLAAPGVNPRAERRGHQLRAQADAQQGAARSQTGFG